MSLVPQVLVTHNTIPQPAIDLLREQNYNVTIMDNIWPKSEEVLKVIRNYDAALGIFKVDSKFLDEAGKRLKVISSPFAGYDHLDVPAIKKRGIRVGNTPRVYSAAVAEMAIFLLLSTIRRTDERRLALKQGKITPGFTMLGNDLQNKVVGIVGLGSVGEAVAKRLLPFEVKKILYSGRSRKRAGDILRAEFVPQDRLLKESDVVINCASLTKETYKMFNDQTFGKMKNNAVFINVGRGQSVDTDALVRALKTNKIHAAGLDVTDPEPLPVDHELLHLSNAVVTPHIGGKTIEAYTKSSILAAQNIIAGLTGKPMPSEL